MASIVKIEKLPELVIDAPNMLHIQESYLRQIANGQPLTAKKKNKSAVAGSTAKIYRQKGTGRARQGERQNPHFRGGGLAFPPQPRLQTKNLNKRVRKMALRSAVLWHVQNGSAWRIDGTDFEKFEKTREAAQVLNSVGGGTLCLVVGNGGQLERSVRNISGLRVVRPETINVRDLVDSDNIVFAPSGFNQYLELLKLQNEPPEGSGPVPGREDEDAQTETRTPQEAE